MKVTKYRKAEKEGYLLSSFGVVFETSYGEFFVNNIRLFQKDGHRWISFPDRKYEKDGEVQFFPECGMVNRNGLDAFRRGAIDAIEKFCVEAQISLPERSVAELQYKDEIDEEPFRREPEKKQQQPIDYPLTPHSAILKSRAQMEMNF